MAPPPLVSRQLQPFAGQDIRWLIDLQSQQRGAHPFLIWEPFEGKGAAWSYSAFADRVRRFAAGLHARGVGPRDRIIVHLDNCPESIFA